MTHAYILKLDALVAYNEGVTESQAAEARATAQEILRLIAQYEEQCPLTMQLSMCQAHAYKIQGCMILEEGRKECLPLALDFLEKSLKILKDIEFGESRVESLIAEVRSRLSGDFDPDELIKLHQEKYKEFAKNLGESSVDTLRIGLQLAEALKSNHHGIRSEDVLSEIYRRSRPSLGEDHHVTKDAVGLRVAFLSRMVSLRSENDARALSFTEYFDEGLPIYQLHCYDKDFEMCHIQGPFGKNVEGSEPGVRRVATMDIVYSLGTPVFYKHREDKSHELYMKLGDIRSHDSDAHSYTIHWKDDTLSPCSLRHCDVVVPIPLQ